MWDLNLKSEVQVMELDGSKIYQIDDVFADPKRLERWLFNRLSFAVEGNPWYNNLTYFVKRRMTAFVDESAPLVTVAQHLCKQKLGNLGGFSTNVESWVDCKYNTYDTHYFWPHLDWGYTCIVYFHDSNGTNLYHPDLKKEEWFKTLMEKPPEGKQPWIPKEKVTKLHTLEAKYNRMVLFDGKKFPHGCAVDNKDFFSETIHVAPDKSRNNLVFFYEDDTPNKTKKK